MGAKHRATVAWQRGAEVFTDHRYSRRYTVHFDGGSELTCSASPDIVRTPFSDPSAVDPEELLIAAVSGCHMLWFLDIAARRGLCVDSYADDAYGILSNAATGHHAFTNIVLRPQTLFSGTQPDLPLLNAMHHQAHQACFIANSIRSEITCKPMLLSPKKPSPQES